MRIALCYPVEDRHIRQIASVAPGAEIIDAGEERIGEEILRADVFCGHAKVHPIRWDRVVASGRLRWIQSSAAGIDHCLTAPVAESSILLTSASGVFADQVAEQTFALLLGLLRGLPVFFRAAQRKEFVRRPTADLHETTVGILGFGGNGRRLAELLAPFRTRIWATDYFPYDRPQTVERLLPPQRCADVLRASDIVVLCVPLTDQTRGMMNRQTLGAMKRGAVLINVARGPVVVEEALVEALESGHLSGAGLDVTEVEPLPPTSRLWDLPNVIITPHVGAQSRRRYDDVTNLFCDNLHRYLQGRPLRNLVDKRLGFPRREPPG
ncbi:MAG: D-2-hydroxyacid dehydrogenase [Planctomycetes bacterium]|nr:D-2-hydroxyacid dehydrogenase [Planctomycetota bacterium]